MYTQFFSLKQAPFSIAPDPRYLFMSERHREALAHLLYGVGSGGGFVLLTGEIGAGKTTVCRCFMEQIPANCKLAYIFNPKLSVEELLLSVCDEFGITLAPQGTGAVSVKTYVDAINRYLLDSHAQGNNNVLVIDEAQNLSADVLEQLRLLTNLETNERKLLQIILIGQPELRTMLARPDLEQLAQRVIARYHLGPLTEAETGSYIEHRLAVAGAAASSPFPRRLTGLVHKLAKGVPRRINLLCDRALLGAYVENQPQVTPAIVRRAAAEVFAAPAGGAGAVRRAWPQWGAGLAAGVLAGVAISAAAWQWLPVRDTKLVSMPVSRAASQVVGAGAGVASKGDGSTSALPVAVGATTGMAPAQAGAATTVATGTAQAGVATAPAGVTGTTPAQVAATASGASGAPAGAAVASSIVPSAAAVAAPAGEGGAQSAPPLRELAALWGQSLPPGEPCQVAARLNLRCLQTRGGVDELRQLDRPAVLTLRDEPGMPRYALLTALDASGATVALDGKSQHLSLAALAERYDGSYTTFWRAPRSWRDEVSDGDRGPDVDWLAKHLSQLYGLKKPVENQPLDAALMRRLREFQSVQHLKADGVAGPKTFIRLLQLAGVREPRLSPGR
ncbi:AAA family ATPase [Duganella sp. LX20W]|uniref:AAA family ATPase n=1 Tax=Rugamonas brunnea TaxID=2758569 RepID=A0A7W2EQZ6_9BURK|nr:AAA family ATPase [Rugamonas brunnea]MBA5637007.1 AAA family ATPase [Rugamonas brunnea]